jgi:hypothetical protein
MWDAFSDERTSLSFTMAAGPRQRSLSRVRVPWISRPYFTVSVLRLPFSSPPMTRRATVEVFDPASTRVSVLATDSPYTYISSTDQVETLFYSCITTQLPSNDGIPLLLYQRPICHNIFSLSVTTSLHL